MPYVYTYMYQSQISLEINLASQTITKLYKVESKSPKTGVKTYRHSIFLEKAFVEDSLFPFKAGETLLVRIDKDRLVIS
ncbi:MAG TPA: hypothetical protein VH796_03140, partial [Nitrososphaeraceae archaeon]